MAYVAVGVNQLFVSKSALCDLGLLPLVWYSKNHQEIDLPMQGTLSAVNDVGTLATNNNGKCHCPMRKRPPETSSSLRMTATEENIPKLEQWIIVSCKRTRKKCPDEIFLQ